MSVPAIGTRTGFAKLNPIFFRMSRMILSLVCFVGLLGCKSRPLGPFVSPRVIGQVIEAGTQKPLSGVNVSRGSPDVHNGSPPKGAELLMRKPPIKTDADGRFELGSERVLSIVRGAGWNIVSLGFEKIGYWPLQTNCLASTATNAPAGDPLLDLGQIELRRLERR